jgi:hypothetical protein
MDAINTAVEHVVNLLAERRYSDLEELTRSRRLTATQIEHAIKEYGREVISPPHVELLDADIVQVEGVSPPRYSVRYDLWTKEEGRSDLSIELTIQFEHYGLQVELDNIHVL